MFSKVPFSASMPFVGRQ